MTSHHIEAKHIVGELNPCSQYGKLFRYINSLNNHNSLYNQNLQNPNQNVQLITQKRKFSPTIQSLKNAGHVPPVVFTQPPYNVSDHFPIISWFLPASYLTLLNFSWFFFLIFSWLSPDFWTLLWPFPDFILIHSVYPFVYFPDFFLTLS